MVREICQEVGEIPGLSDKCLSDYIVSWSSWRAIHGTPAKEQGLTILSRNEPVNILYRTEQGVILGPVLDVGERYHLLHQRTLLPGRQPRHLPGMR